MALETDDGKQRLGQGLAVGGVVHVLVGFIESDDSADFRVLRVLLQEYAETDVEQ